MTETSGLSLSNKVLIISFTVILVLVVKYFAMYVPSSRLPISQFKIVKTNECDLSMKESDNWFCETDSDWKRRKINYHLQDKRNKASDTRFLFFQNNWEPTTHCKFERRLGNVGDGGKWVCDVHRIEQMNNTNPLVYSFGSNGDFSFEKGIKEVLPKAEIHTFDATIYQCKDNLCIFHQARLGDGKSENSKSLQTIIRELGHQKREISILKVDIEGSEFKLFGELFRTPVINQTDIPYIRQILFEIHLGPAQTIGPSQQTHRLFELFRENNYAIFHKEVNLYDPANVFEYALIRLNPLFFQPSV